MPSTPIWRRAVGQVDDFVSPRADSFVRGETFAVSAGLVRRIQIEIYRRTERQSRRLWHLLNLPAGSDVNRLLSHIALLERELRDLRKEISDRDAEHGKTP